MYSSDIIFSCFTCFPVFVRGKHNFSSILFAECDRDRHLDKLIHQTKGWTQAFLSLNLILLKRSVNRTLINLEQHEPVFWYPDCCSLKSAEPEEVPLKHPSCKSWTNDHLLSPITIVLPQEKRRRNRSWKYLPNCSFICMIASDSPRCDLELGISRHCGKKAIWMVKYKMERVELCCQNIRIILNASLDVCLQVRTEKSMSLSQVLYCKETRMITDLSNPAVKSNQESIRGAWCNVYQNGRNWWVVWSMIFAAIISVNVHWSHRFRLDSGM